MSQPQPEPASRAAASSPLDERCRAMIAAVRARCPGLLPVDDLPAGEVAAPVSITAGEATALISTALRESVATAVTGRVPPAGADLPATVLWEEGADSLLVLVGSLKIQLDDGEVTVQLPVRCDQIPRGTGVVTVRLVVGTQQRPAGLFAAASSVPEGPPVVVRRWADALTALAWSALLESARGIARRTGRDVDGTGLVPVALSASREGLIVLPQARHGLDRVAGG